MPTKNVKLSRPGANPVRESDLRIKKALNALTGIDRGRQALRDFRRFAEGSAGGLDLSYMSELMVLVREWAIGGRRDFLSLINTNVGPEPCRYCGEVDCEDPKDCPKRRRHEELDRAMDRNDS